MPTLLKEIKTLFGTDCLYDILRVPKSADRNEIRKAYYRLSLVVHPDRVQKTELESATKKFQALGKIYEVLSSDEKRALYDESGEIDDECSISNDDRDWYDYWRLLFARVKMEDIEQFEKKYKGSDEELDDLKKAYIDAKGDMDQIIDKMLCATVHGDEQRFRSIIQGWIDSKAVKSFAKFTKETAAKQERRKRKAEEEAAEAEQELKKLNKSGELSLSALIQKNQKARSEHADDFFKALEEKYGKKAHVTPPAASKSKRKSAVTDSSKSSTTGTRSTKAAKSGRAKKGK